jgi:hypothetical protein
VIRQARFADIARLVEIGAPFIGKLPGVPKEANQATIGAYFGNLIASPDAAVFVAERLGRVAGVICGRLLDDPYTSTRVLLKTSWIVDPALSGDGAHLLRAFERWGRANGATRVIVSALEGDRDTAKMLSHLGFLSIETNYEKAL